MAKVKVTEKRFIDWYFSDEDDKLVLANNLISELLTTGKVVRTAQDILNECQYVPGFITEDGDEDEEYSSEDVELVNDRVPIICPECGVEDDGSMENFCQNCLSSK